MHRHKFVVVLIIIASVVAIYLQGRDRIGSKEINLSFNIPPGYRAEYKAKTNDKQETIDINYGSTGNPEWMSIQIAGYSGCEAKIDDNQEPILVAGKWPLSMSKSHARYGFRDQIGTACLDNNKVMTVYRYVRDNEGEVETQFDQILESANYSPGLSQFMIRH